MNRHQKELRLAELTVSRDILNQQIEAIRRELASDGLQIWKDHAPKVVPLAFPEDFESNPHSYFKGVIK